MPGEMWEELEQHWNDNQQYDQEHHAEMDHSLQYPSTDTGWREGSRYYAGEL